MPEPLRVLFIAVRIQVILALKHMNAVALCKFEQVLGCVCICVYVCVCVCVHCMCVYMCVYVCVHVYVCTCVYVWMCICVVTGDW